MAKNNMIKDFFKPGRHVHLVGIGGVSMRPLGLVLQGMGMTVTGSDMNASVSTDELIAKGFRAEIDFRNEKLGYKIRESQTQKVPYTLVLGDDEMNAGTVNVRPYGTEEQNTESLDEFMDKLSKDVSNYSRED